MKTLIKTITIILMVLLSYSCQQKEKQPTPVKVYPHFERAYIDREIMNEINIARIENNLDTLTFKQELTNVAASHSKYMADNNTMNHDYVTERQNHFPDQYLGECVATNFRTANATVEAWLNSPRHREAMLSSKYVSFGVATVYNGKNQPYVTALFLTK